MKRGHLTRENENRFPKRLKKGDVFTYSPDFFLSDVYRIAFKNGRGVEYCGPKTQEYLEHGDMTCRVVYVDKES